ncbi:MAG: hypothetical protein CL678_13365 [Bdellovibrionaceae bacterium]|nr:hypothetical protein [Pseudobdellovibrionaceae bacterium]|tara:strand:- start:523 stop:1884 length:1362 start_codon:yes stop_codon:yes gene_type:complete
MVFSLFLLFFNYTLEVYGFDDSPSLSESTACRRYSDFLEFEKSVRNINKTLSHTIDQQISYFEENHNLSIEDRCKDNSPIKIEETLISGVKKGVSCLMNLGRKSKKDALRLLGLFHLKQPFKVWCRKSKEPYFIHFNDQKKCSVPGAAVAKSHISEVEEYPLMVLNQDKFDFLSEEVLFHESLHALGYLHGVETDIVYAAHMCCFGRESVQGRFPEEAVQAACEILKKRPRPRSKKGISLYSKMMSGFSGENRRWGSYWSGGESHLLALLGWTRKGIFRKISKRPSARKLKVALIETARSLKKVPKGHFMSDKIALRVLSSLVQRILPQRQTKDLVSEVDQKFRFSNEVESEISLVSELIEKMVFPKKKNNLAYFLNKIKKINKTWDCEDSAKDQLRGDMNRFLSWLSESWLIERPKDDSLSMVSPLLRRGIHCKKKEDLKPLNQFKASDECQ